MSGAQEERRRLGRRKGEQSSEVASRETKEGEKEKFIGGMKKWKDGGEGGKRWW